MSIEEFYWDEIASSLIDRLNNIAKALNVSYKEISEVLNVDQAYINKILNKKRDLTFPTFIKICLVLAEINKEKKYPLKEYDLMPSALLKQEGL